MQLQRDVQDELAWEPSIRDAEIGVAAKDAVVTLSGYVDTFAEKFLAKCTLSEMISRYMVLVASEQKLLMMRPYQIYAVKHLVDTIHKNSGNGYIWHSPRSGDVVKHSPIWSNSYYVGRVA